MFAIDYYCRIYGLLPYYKCIRYFYPPIIIVIILLVTGYIFIGKRYNFAALSVINYYALCSMTGVAMGFVLGGSFVRIEVA